MNENDLKRAADAAGKVLGDSNAAIQEKGPAAVSFIQKYWWVGVGAVALLFAAFFLA